MEAGISILCAKERLFERSEPYQRNAFNPVFDEMVLITAICIVFPNKDHKRRAECIDVREIDMQKQKSIFAESNFMPKSPSTWRCVRLAPPFKTFDSAFSKLSKTLQHIPLNQIPPNSDTDFSHGAMCNTSDLLFHAITPPRPTPDLSSIRFQYLKYHSQVYPTVFP